MIGGSSGFLNITNNRMKMNNKTPTLYILLLLFCYLQLLLPCSSLNTQGMALLKFREKVVRDPFDALANWGPRDGVLDHCSWKGVLCSGSNVVVLNLKDLCLGGTLAPELGLLPHIKSIMLRNNSFSGVIPSEIGDLTELEVLDLGYNNFSGPLPSNFGNNFSLSILLLDNNDLLGSLSPELDQFQMLSEHQVDENELRGAPTGRSCNSESISWYGGHPNDLSRRSLLQETPTNKENRRSPLSFTFPPLPSSKSRSPAPPHSLRPTHSPPAPPQHLPKKNPRSPSPPPASTPSPKPRPPPAPAKASTPPSSVPPKVVPVTATPPHAPSPSPIDHKPKPAAAPAKASAPSSSVPPKVVPITPTTPHAPSPSPIDHASSAQNHHKVIIWAVGGASAFMIIAAAVVMICRSSKVVTVKPWATGLSGQLQRAFVTGVPKLKRSELEVACEDFSNIIGSLTDGTVYKGTLSSGAEIAVVASSVKSPEDWSKHLELQYRKKIETLSNVNHKNFVNLIGFCEEEKPFTRMMVFEYAPNGTLFEHLHIKEAERLDWKMRLRIAVGMAYCLEYMHQLDTPIPHRDLQSSAIYLSEDYAAKISDFSFWNEGTRSKMRSPSMQLWEATSTDIESNVFNFGIVLIEMITGRMPYMEDDFTLAEWVLDFLEKDHIPREFMDPTLSSYKEEEVQRLFDIIRECVHPDSSERPTMREVVAHLREMTGMGPDGACPRLSPLWWAELEVMSTEGF